MAKRGNEEKTARKPARLWSNILPQRTHAKPPEGLDRWYSDEGNEAGGHIPKQELGSLAFAKGSND